MTGIAYSIDFTDFNKKLMGIIKDVPPDDVSEGLRQALQKLKLDADNIPPRTPHLEGHLRGSGKVHKIKIDPTAISGELTFGGKTVDFNVPYAARWHEAEPGTVNWSEPDVGPKFLESKLIKFMETYIAMIASIIKKRSK